ncbi:type I polyketide synthase [Stieleria varia]|uniref:Mycocerosic acid synthase n=1 Tax=Stieleria varia TaxID=2528005 RepID=A0A5C6B145_9BACT|nr:type I polyketide synthase [Stieleria varia]TWU05016.1 Mycocerosic acid synthase [Stieleria varia]
MSDKTRKPLAIVGMACRFPKGLESIEALWNALKNRFSAIDTVPPDRWTVDRYYSSNAIAKGKSYLRRGGFLTHDVQQFDAGFFGISPRDAENMDPQQRLLLEVVWEAFENSGMILPQYSGRKVGVYVGGFMLDHMITQMSASNRSAINQNTAAGMMMTMLSNRISHTFDFRGPSLSIDTACSSSLVAFHVACQDLWRGDGEMAIVGGSNVMLRPEYPMGMCKGAFLSRDGQCKSFDSRGDGYGRGEGAGIVLVKPLDQAIQDGDPILATVIATGINQDGRTPGISMPSGDAQRELIEDVCLRNQIDPASIHYVECHGTGTAIGDPTETKAIGAVYGRARREKNRGPVVVGSIKSNIGHLEAAAGVAGIIKATLTVLNQQATPLASLETPNPGIPADEWNVRLSDEMMSVGDEHGPLRVAVNSFGYGGSNAHVILEAAPPASDLPRSASSLVASPADTICKSMPHMLPISARSDAAVTALAGKYAELLRDTNVDLIDFLHTAAFHRAHLSSRSVVMGNDRAQLIAGLDALAKGEDHENVVRDTEPFQGKREPVFVFTGMGPQWWAMGQELYQSEPVYRQAVDEADSVFVDIAGFSALQEMLKDEASSQITRTEFAQPCNFLIQIGLLAVLKDAGIRPGAVVGHSVGELGSAYAAGALSLRDAMTVCYHRSRLQATCKGTGSMLAVGLSKEQVLSRIGDRSDKVSVAAVNGPSNVTIAGDADTISDIAAELTCDEIFNKLLDVEVPYHSPMMDPILDELRHALVDVRPAEPKLPLYSTVTGEIVHGITYGADYWPENVRQPVEFSTAIQSLLQSGFNTFFEIGPHPVLTTSIRDCAKAAGADCRNLHTLRRKMTEQNTLRRGVAGVHASGCQIDWLRYYPEGELIRLPNYAWQREFHWVENDRAKQDRIAPIDHPILGIQEAPGAPVYRNDFDHETVLYLRDHVVSGMPILPAAGYIEALLELAAIKHPDAKGFAVRDLLISAPMIITAERGLDSVTTYEPMNRSATIRSLENGRLGAGQVHVTAKLSGIEHFQCGQNSRESLLDLTPVTQDIEAFYRDLDSIGLSYGPAFQTIRELRRSESGDMVFTRVEVNSDLQHNLNQYLLHPTLLDACFQSLMLMLGESDTTYLPTGFDELCIYAANLPGELTCLAERVSQDDRRIECDLTLMTVDGTVVGALRGMQLTAAAKRERRDRFGDRIKRQVLRYDWTYGETLSEPKRLGHWLIVGDENEIAQTTIDQLERFGARVSGTVAFGDSFRQDGRRYILRQNSCEDAGKLMESVGDLDGIAFLHGLSSKTESEDPTGEVAIGVIVTITQAMLTHCSERPPRAYVVTQNACEVNQQDSSVEPAQSALNGFTRVAFNELEGHRFSSIDLPEHVDETVLDNLTLELLCDSEHDEVALRGSFRLHSELLDSTVLSDDLVQRCPLDEQHPVLVRPLRPDCESVGTARVVACQLPSLSPEAIQLRIDTTLVPEDLLQNQTADSISQPLVEVVATVLSVGDAVRDLSPGMRVAGFAPADLVSHRIGDRSSFFLEQINASTDAAGLLTVIEHGVRAECAATASAAQSGQLALVVADTLGFTVAMALSRRGMRVAMLCQDEARQDATLVPGVSVYSYCPEGIAQAVREQTDGVGFDLLAAPLANWQEYYGFHMIAPGGTIMDLDSVSGSVELPSQVNSIVRTDLSVLMRRRDAMSNAIGNVIKRFEAGELAPAPSLEITIADLGWQKLPLADTNAQLVLHFETDGGDLPVVTVDDLSFSPDATYLVTGGFGGFGRRTAQWLVQHGARNLVLTGRTGADTDDRCRFVDELSSLGVHVVHAACDTSDLQAVERVLQQITSNMPALKGVFHSGAVILDQPIAEMDLETLTKVMRSKALGAWNLHLLTRDLELDHFVLYSSVANLVGNSRQSAYSAANGFLNGLAHLRQQMGLPGTSVNWGAIADVGVVANDEKLEQFLRYTGLRGIQSSEALELLRIGLSRKVPQFGVTMITSWADWARFETRGSTSPRFQKLIEADSTDKDSSTKQALIEELSKLDPADQVELLGALMLEIIASVLKSDPAAIPIDKSIDQLGVDSLMATEIQMLLDTQLGLSVSVLELIGDTTIRSLAAQSAKKLNLQGQSQLTAG